MTEFPVNERIGHHIKRAELHLIAAKHSAVQAFGLTVPQYTVLLVLSTDPGLTGASLARRCLVTPQTMSAVLSTMERGGLIERLPHATHRHVLETRLTPLGKGRLRKADEAAAAVEWRLSELFTPEERASFLEYLNRCSTALEG